MSPFFIKVCDVEKRKIMFIQTARISDPCSIKNTPKKVHSGGEISSLHSPFYSCFLCLTYIIKYNKK
ncbi:hypothetical protein XO11_08725 [Marinitoga sp. 1138]|nr:hypothetical protein [Marinitoga sp. 1138]